MSQKGSPIFKGNYPYALDEKGRLTLPSSLREEITRSTDIPERLYLSYFPANSYLAIYTYEVWNEVVADFSQAERYPSTAVKTAAQRLLFANVETVSMDKASRILIPANYREKIGVDLGQKVIVNGAGPRIEIWSPEIYAANELKDIELWRAAQELEEKRALTLGPETARLPEC
ncbi:MAG: hypothetical protein LBS60_10385 [Deltaproteobacteria bacterium]|jgi:MraZ protein|nr:hypothetical protein [Deltaproteobacteria bacterium]